MSVSNPWYRIRIVHALVGVILIAAVMGVALATPAFLATQWRVINDTNEPQGRHENAYVEVNGKFYLMGGRGIRPLEIYNPTDSTWTRGSGTPESISLHHFQAAALDNVIYILAAYTGTFPDEDLVENIYTYDTESDQWEVGPVIPEARRRASAGVVLHNGKFYVVCGSTGGHGDLSIRSTLFDEYDPVTNTWTPLPNAPNARDHVHAAMVDNKLYVTGGRDGGLSDNVPEVDVYNFSTGEWSTLPASTGNIPTPRAGAASIAVGKYVVVIGGESSRQMLAHDEVEVLDTSTNTWDSIAGLRVGRHGTQAVLYNDHIYITAGSGQRGGTPELVSHEVFDTMEGTSLPVELSPEFLAVVDEDQVILKWKTLSETNNAGFEIQHLQGGVFETVGFVEGHGTSVSPRTYSFTRKGLVPGRHVFRLKQIDFDGTFAYSPEVSAFIHTTEGFHLGAIYPNPLNPQARFDLTLTREQEVAIEVFDMLGRQVDIVHSGILMPYEPHSFLIDGDGWAGGKYLLNVKGEYFSSARIFTILK